MRRAARIAFVSVAATLEVACFLVAVFSWESAGADFGWNVGTRGATISNVEPEGPAARAGLQAGDEIVYATLPVLGRINLLLSEGVTPGSTLTFQVLHRGTVRSVTMAAEEFPTLGGISYVFYALGAVALGLVGLVLLLLRPSRMTWGCALIAPTFLIPAAVYLGAQRAPTGIGVTFQCMLAVLYGLQATGFMVFASRFPSDRPRGLSRWIDRLAIPLGAFATATYLYVTIAIYASPTPPFHWALIAQDYAITAFSALCAMAALLSTYVAAARADRSRLLPVIAAFFLLIVAVALQEFSVQITSSFAVDAFFDFLFAVAALLVAAAVSYGVVRHRVIDVDFIVSRTLVYTILTVFVVAIFALIEYVIGKILERGRLAELLEVAAAVGVGISMNYLHNWLDRFLDVVLFRRRYEAEQRLSKTANTLPHATSLELVDDMLVEEPCDALGLASAAVFRREGARYARKASAAWNDATAALDDDDHLVLRLRAELQALDTGALRWPRRDLPSGNAQPIYAVPVVIGHRLEAIAERQLRQDVARLEGENATLRGIERKLTELLESSIGRKDEREG